LADRLFDETFLRKLEQLSLIAHKIKSGHFQGQRRSTKRGTSVEFADYRNYVHGDDLRHVDWNIYARLERPFVKLFEEEEDLAVHILVDSSLSMDWPTTENNNGINKWNYARRTAASLAYVALSGGDIVKLTLINPQKQVEWGPHRGRGHLMRLLDFLEKQTPRGTTDLRRDLRDYSIIPQRRGLLFLISDLFSQTGYHDALTRLLARGYEASLLHLLAPGEIDPDLQGDLRLYDVETGEEVEVTIDGWMKKLYRQHLSEWQEDIGRFCLSRDINYVTVNTAIPFEKLILTHLRQRGMVR
jgi:uncharacterized protein (DUF58 family)